MCEREDVYVFVCVYANTKQFVCAQCDGQPQYHLYLAMNVTLVQHMGEGTIKDNTHLKSNKQMNTRTVFNATYNMS